MKTVTGRVLSTKPISLPKAASILSKFVSAETGASQAVCAYLRRASFSFNELAQLHKDPTHHRKHKTPKLKTGTADENPTRSAVSSQPELTQELSRGTGRELGVESENKKHRKKGGEIKNLEVNKGELGIGEDGNLGMETERRKQKKNKKEKEKRGGEIANPEEDKGKVGIEANGDVELEKEKSRSEIDNFGDNEVGENVVEGEEERKKKKKRKSGERIEDGIEMNSEELHSKKKKRRKSEGQS